MNKIKILTVFTLGLLLNNNINAQSECNELLQDGLYSFTEMTNTKSFGKDLKTYYLSEKFKSDMKSGKWGGSISIPIDGVPFSLDANASDSKFAELRTKLLSTSELKIEDNNVQVLLQSIPNTNLYESYVNCREIEERQGFSGFVQGKNVETEDAVVFTIYYKPSSPSDPMPTVTNFSVVPTGSVISGELKIGDKLTGFTTLITCKRPIDKDLILSIETDRGAISSKASAQDNIASSKEYPIGTVITSFLNFEQFNTATKNNEKSPGGIWTSQKSKWSPCDGRPVPNSKYQKLTSQNSIPDLRGMFIRGLNQFDPFQPVPKIDASKADPDNRTSGSYQFDAIRDHKHQVNYQRGRVNDSNGGGHNHEVTDGERTTNTTTHKCNECKTETRPKNVAVYYYVKIN